VARNEIGDQAREYSCPIRLGRADMAVPRHDRQFGVRDCPVKGCADIVGYELVVVPIQDARWGGRARYP
jgi:hypothetical protein